MKITDQNPIVAFFLTPIIVCGIHAVQWPADSLLSAAVSLLFWLIFGVLLSISTAVFIFLPGLYLTRMFSPLTAPRAAFLGAISGALGYLPIAFLFIDYNWHTDEMKLPWEFVVRDQLEQMAVMTFCAAISALGYWRLEKHQRMNKNR